MKRLKALQITALCNALCGCKKKCDIIVAIMYICIMKIYLDNCCYCRPYDKHAQQRVRNEAQAVLDAIEFCKAAGHCIVSSAVINKEMDKIKDGVKLGKVQKFYRDTAPDKIRITPEIVKRGKEFQAYGVKVPDCFHLACAEAAGADYLLTTDDQFISSAARTGSKIKVINPLNFLPEWRM